MNVYLFNQNYFTKIILPTVIDGVYPVCFVNKRFLTNIEEEDGKWFIQKSIEVSISKDGKQCEENVMLVPFEAYILKDNLFGVEFILLATPSYDDTLITLSTNSKNITIGNNNCDITYNSPYFKSSEPIKLVKENTYWQLVTNDKNVFVSDKRASNSKLRGGDYIFYYGLKIIVVNNLFIINNPKNAMTYSQQTFTLEKERSEDKVEAPLLVDDTPLYSKDDFFMKSPRFMTPIITEKVTIDPPPTPIVANDMPTILAIGPQLTMLCTTVVTLISNANMFLTGRTDSTRFLFTTLTMVITLTGTLMWPTLSRKFNEKRVAKNEKKRQEKYRQYLQEKKHKIFLIKSKQRQTLIEKNISLDNCKNIIATKSKYLWQRNIEHEDFLQIRLGEGNVPSRIEIDSPEDKFSIEDRDSMIDLLNSLINESKLIPKTPYSINLTEKIITAVVGKEQLTKKFLDSVFLQIMTFHAFTELKVVVLTSEDNKDKWGYLRILPHCWNDQKSERYFATNVEEMNIISASLEKIFIDRIYDNEEANKIENGDENLNDAIYKKYKPYYLVFTDEILTSRNIPIVKRILEYKQNVGFSLFILNDRLSTLPSETSTFINIDEPMSGLVCSELVEENQAQFVAEYCSTVDVYSCAQQLANVPIQVAKAKYELPSSLSFLEMFGVGKVEQLNSIERWKNNNPVVSLSVPVGVDQNGELFKMDIHEKAYGPHGLIAGTTGSGKSEWIVTYMLSLAVNFHPDEVQFVVIDYKGGGLAMSFENTKLGIKLPHLAGTVTNLDKSAVNRVISSIESELKRRQSIFNDAREKLKEGSMNIYKYQQFYRKGQVTEPMSHLLIISDEFAELKAQQPEFMDQLVSTSRIGRSLGVHLILATQKPSGVVNEQIWSNSRFKVCLRVQDKGDSQEILKKPDAAYLKQTGAFYLEVGNDEYYNLGQSAWAGAKYYPSDVLKKKIDQSVQSIDNIGRVVNNFDDEDITKVERICKGEELLNVIQYIDSLKDKVPMVKKQLWLPNVPEIIYLSNIVKKYNHKPVSFNYNVVIGEYDDPSKQEQNILKINLFEGNIGIIGQTGSGKESLISTIIWSSIVEHTPQEINYYVFDFGAETLKKFAKFPHVGEVVFQNEVDRMAGVMEIINEEIETRKELFSDYNGSFDYYNKKSGKTVPLIVMVINAFDVLSEVIPKLYELINTMFRDAPKYGIIFIVTASSSSGIRQRQLQFFRHIIMMQMQDESSYRNVTNCKKGLIPSRLFGRGICKIGYDDESYCEFQTAKITTDDQLIEYIKATADKLSSYYKVKARELTKVPETVNSEELSKYVTTLESVPIGFNFYEKDIAKINYMTNKINLITSKNIKDTSKFICALIKILVKIPNTKVRVVDMIKMIEDDILDIQYFNNDLDAVFAALKRDVLERKETQDWAVTIIIGAGNYKKTLKKGCLEIANTMFNSILASKKSIFILVDNYDKMKHLKVEPWFATVDTTTTLWLGAELNSQSLFNVEEVREEDKKLYFEGLGFNIVNSKYTVLKTMLEGDEE